MDDLSNIVNRQRISLRQLLIILIISYVSFSLYYTYNYAVVDDVQVYHWSRCLSNLMGYINSLYIPIKLRPYLYNAFSSFYNVDTNDFLGKFEDYETMVDFFTRPVKPRYIPNDPNCLVSPADSKILSVSEVTGDSVFLVKGKTYSFSELVTGKNQKFIGSDFLSKMKTKKENKIFSAIFYLSPGDYHRYHSPADLILKQRIHIAGLLYPVKPSFVQNNDRVYEGNERVSVFSRYSQGNMILVFVGATNVGSMTLDTDPELQTDKFKFEKKIDSKS